MSERVAHVRRAPASRRRGAPRRTVRRRRAMFGLAFLALAAILAFALAPFFRHAVRELQLPLRHEDIIRQQALEKHLDPALIAAVIYAESKFREGQTSSAGALGLMQITPDTARFLAHRSGGTNFVVADLATPQVNIAYGSYYLRYLLDRYHEHVVPALAAYNAGEANVDRWEARNGHALTRTDIPFPETRAYVAKVIGARADYAKTYHRELGLR